MTLLSHYTSRAGLEGIAKTRTFWATSALNVNDTSEFFYAWFELNKAAATQFMEMIPPDKRQAGYDVDKMAAMAVNDFKKFIAGTDGYGSLFITSFARGTTEDHERRGILTLWDRYTKHEGYCIQFDRDDVRRTLELECSKANYEWAGIENVKYGVDKNEREFRDLVFQLSQQFLIQALRSRDDIYVEPAIQRVWANSTIFRKLMHFCATHKDPFFEDEREVRIFAYPAPMAESRVFTGIASKKEICTSPDGKKYIVLGDVWRPGICPRRIIVGAKASPDLTAVLANYEVHPEVVHANLPVA